MFLYSHRYNIQIRKKTRLRLYSLSPLKVLLVRRMGLEPTHLAALTPEASASTNSAIFAQPPNGDPDENRTHDRQLRKLILYPTELRDHKLI